MISARLLLDSTAEAIYGLDPQGICTFCNAACVRILGYDSADQIIGSNMHDLIHHSRDDGTAVPATECQLLKGLDRQIHSDREVFWRADGNSFPVEYWSYPIQQDGKSIGMVVSFVDIAERKKADKALEEMQELRDRAEVIAHIGSWKLDLATSHLTWSDEVYRIFGCEPQSFPATYETFLSFIHPADRTAVATAYSDSLREGNGIYEIEHRIIRQDNGEVRYVYEQGEHKHDAVGAVTQSFGMVQDITERKKDQEQQRLAQFSIEYTSDAVFWVDTQGQFKFVNAAACQQLGYSRDELLNMSVADIDPDWPEEKWPEHFEQLRQHKQLLIETCHRTKNGEILDVEVSANYFKQQDMEFNFAFVRNVTKRKQMEETLRLQAQRAEALLELPRLADEYDEKSFMQRAQEMAEDLTGSKIAFIHFINDGGQEIALTTWSRRTLEHYCTAAYDSHYPVSKAGIWADALREGKPVIFNDYPNYSYKKGLPEGHSMLQRLISVPVIENGQVVMLAGVGNKDTDYTDCDSESVQLIASAIWQIVKKIRMAKISKEATERIERLARHVPGALYQFQLRPDGSFRFPYASRGIQNIYGVLPEQVIDDAKAAFRAIHPEDLAQVNASIQESARTLNPWTDQYRVNLSDGQTIWVEGESTPEAQSDGSILWHGYLRDITQQKQAEEALEKRLIALTQPLDNPEGIEFEELFNIADIQRLQDGFARATGVGSMITRSDGTPITEPSNFCFLCSDIIRKTEIGYANCLKSDALLGNPNPDGPTVQVCLSGGLWDAGAAITVGGRHIANWLVGQVRDENQSEEKIRAYAQIIGADEESVAKAFRDVPAMSRWQFDQIANVLFILANQLSNFAYQNTQQARFITERKQIENALRESEDRFKALHNASFGGIAIHDQGIIFDCNQGLSEISGFEYDELIGRDALLLIAEQSRETVRNNILSAYDKPYEVFGLRKRGQEYPLRLDAKNIPYQGKMVRVVEFRDITERKRAQLALQQKNEEMEQFVYSVTHDIKSPLVTVKTFAGMLRQDLQGGDQQQIHEDLDYIDKATDKMQQLLDALLQYSRIGRVDTPVQPLSAGQSLKDCLAALAGILQQHHVHVSTSELPYLLHGDPLHFGQIWQNLIENAVKYRGDQLQPQIEIGATHQGQDVVFYVRDNGMGIAPEHSERIFNLFSQLNPGSDGSGLGLALVKKIVTIYQGRIWLESEGKGMGSCFYFTLPGALISCKTKKSE